MLFCLLVLEWLKGKVFLLPSFSLCCHFDSHRVLYLFIRPLRWGHFCRLKQKYPKVRFFIRRIWKPNFPFAGEKGKYRLPMRLQRFRLLISLFKKHQSAIIFKPHSVMVFSQRKLKRTVSLSFSPRISCGGFICSALIFSFVGEFRETTV